MPIIEPTVENPDTLLAWPGPEGPVNRIQIERSATGGGAGYSNIGSVTITPATRDYRFYDVNGANSDWYRWYFSNAGNTFPTAGNRAYSTEAQPGDETGGLICSVEDVEQTLGETLEGNDREIVLDLIRQVTTSIEGYCERWFIPRPLSGTQTQLLSPGHDPRVRILGDRRTVLFPMGVRSLASYGYAVTDQPTSSGTYTSVSSTQWVLVPSETGWPSTRVMLLSTAGASLYEGLNTIQWVGGFGFSAVPADIQGVGIRAVVRRKVGKGGGGGPIALGPNGTEFLLPDMSGSDRRILDWYRSVPVG